MKEDPYFWQLVEEAKDKHAKEKAAGFPSYTDRYRELYRQRNRGEISLEDFHRQAAMTPEQIEQEELSLGEPTTEDVAGDEYLMNHNPTQQEIEDLEERVKEVSLDNAERDVTEIDHPWHVYLPWKSCYRHDCTMHWLKKDKNNHFPQARIPVYYDWNEMMKIIQRRRSTSQLQSKN